MRLTAADRSQADIARILGVSEKAVERMLANERRRQEKRAAG
jgi:DNA-directed RNA polymerase specialized sigma24 family protein